MQNLLMMKEKFEQLIKQSEENIAKMKEALAKMEEVKFTPQYPTTYEEIAEVVKPRWLVMCQDGIAKHVSFDSYQLPTEFAAKQAASFGQIKVLEAYCKEKFAEDATHFIDITSLGILRSVRWSYTPFKFSPKAAEWVIETFPQIFKIYYGIEK